MNRSSLLRCRSISIGNVISYIYLYSGETGDSVRKLKVKKAGGTGYVVVCPSHTIYLIMSQDAVFENLAASLSVILKLLPGLTPFTLL